MATPRTARTGAGRPTAVAVVVAAAVVAVGAAASVGAGASSTGRSSQSCPRGEARCTSRPVVELGTLVGTEAPVCRIHYCY